MRLIVRGFTSQNCSSFTDEAANHVTTECTGRKELISDLGCDYRLHPTWGGLYVQRGDKTIAFGKLL